MLNFGKIISMWIKYFVYVFKFKMEQDLLEQVSIIRKREQGQFEDKCQTIAKTTFGTAPA
jgi:hypothetical protein